MLSPDERRYQQAVCQLYDTIGYACHEISQPLARRRSTMPAAKDKITLFAGTGGEDTLINQILPQANLAIGRDQRRAQHGHAHHHLQRDARSARGSIPIDGWVSKASAHLTLTEELTSYFRDIFQHAIAKRSVIAPTPTNRDAPFVRL